MKYALVTGGSRGIGRAVSCKLAEMGYFILINYQNNDAEAEKTLQLVQEKGSNGELMKFDVTDPAAITLTLGNWASQHPDEYIEVLINNAGIRKDNLITKPETVPYPSTKIRYRHYGRTLEVLIKKAIDFPEGDEKQNLVALICNHMKKDYMSWNKDTVDDRKIADDLAELSGGKLQMTDSLLRLMAERIEQNYRPKMNNQNNRNNNRNNKRKY